MRRQSAVHVRPAAHRSGFTLLEMIVAVTIMALVAAMMASVITSAFRMKDSAEYAVDVTRDTEIIGDHFCREMANVVPPGAYWMTDPSDPNNMGAASAVATTTPATQPVLSLYGPFYGDNEHITFYASGAQASLKIPDQPYAAIQYEEFGVMNTDSGPAFAQAVNTDLLSDASQNDPTSELETTVLVTHVKSVQFRYYDGQGNWLDTWDSTDTTDYPQALPLAVSIELHLEPLRTGDPDRIIKRFASINCAVPASLPATTTDSGGITGGVTSGFGGF